MNMRASKKQRDDIFEVVLNTVIIPMYPLWREYETIKKRNHRDHL
jgi:hypothetical protein